ncbi:MAG: hypothetical protein IPO00_02265 [Betaproteobacteria bacterium]|nr:hypothetical protein [Betaproteobacteria bacterium]
MGKLLLMIFLGVAIWWLWRKLQATKADAALPKAERPPELMARCAHCGVNQPRSECVEGAGQAVYCSDAHRREAESRSAGE